VFDSCLRKWGERPGHHQQVDKDYPKRGCSFGPLSSVTSSLELSVATERLDRHPEMKRFGCLGCTVIVYLNMVIPIPSPLTDNSNTSTERRNKSRRLVRCPEGYAGSKNIGGISRWQADSQGK
jgi:hypothetical protein